MFWFEFRSVTNPGTTYVTSAEGLTRAEHERATSDPNFVREFQGNKYGEE